jgi:hypothetical protein
MVDAKDGCNNYDLDRNSNDIVVKGPSAKLGLRK